MLIKVATEKCLLALISKQNATLDPGESVWMGNLSME